LFLAHHFTGPIEELVQGAEEIGKGNFAVTIPVRSEDELGRLSGRFNAMARQLAEIDQMKDDFIANVSHDLRSPLASIIMSGEYLLTQSHGSLTQVQQQMIDIIVRSGHRLSAFINNILDAAKIKAGRMEYAFQSRNLTDLIKENVESLEGLARSKNITLAFQPPPEFPAVRADGEKLQQVVGNLLSNAIKFTPAGGTITIVQTLDGSMARVSIADTGRGIPSTELPKLFQKFSQINVGHEPGMKVRGTGLGLVIVKEMVQAHGGKVWVDSTPGKGSTFYFTVPIADAGGSDGKNTNS
jgi:two-component system sensor histidine kinase GlrK